MTSRHNANAKNQHLTKADPDFKALPTTTVSNDLLQYLLKVYADNYISLAIGRSQYQFRHVSDLIIQGIHDVFLPNTDDNADTIKLKKLLKNKGAWYFIK